MLVNGIPYAFANVNTEKTIQFNSIEEVRDYASANKDINIIVLDEVGTVTNEIHCDGSYIDYTYSNGLISEIKNSNGYSRKYLYNDDEVRTDEFKDGKLIKSKTYNRKEKEEKEKKLISEKDTNFEINTVSPLSINTSTSTRGTYENYNVYGVYGTKSMNNLISNYYYQFQSLNQSEIQSFLESHNSTLKNGFLVIRQEYYNGPYILTSTIPVIPSQVIANYAQQYNINPKLILVTLQKEKSLISTTYASPSSDSILWAMGVGCYSYYKEDWDYFYCGFDRQIKYGAKTFRDRFDEVGGTYPKKIDLDQVTVVANGHTYKDYIWVDNRATEALYIYTPYAIDPSLWYQQGLVSGGNYLIKSIFDGYWSTWG